MTTVIGFGNVAVAMRTPDCEPQASSSTFWFTFNVQHNAGSPLGHSLIEGIPDT